MGELEDWLYLENKKENEGFYYCFKHYSDWSEIKDKKFHSLRKKYLKISEQLNNYIYTKINDLEKLDDII